MIGLTHKQRDCLSFIQNYLDEHGSSPSFDNIKDALGLTSKSGVHRLLTALEERGRIRRLHDRARSIEVIPLSQFDGVPTSALVNELHRRGAAHLAVPA